MQVKFNNMQFLLTKRAMKQIEKSKAYRRDERLKMIGIKRRKPHEWQIVKGDIVEVIRGRDEGKQGKVIQVFRSAESVRIDGINLRLKKTRDQQGVLKTIWTCSPVLARNVALVDQDTGIPTPIRYKYQQSKIDAERYVRVRQSVVSGDIIDKPKESKPVRTLREAHPTKDTSPDLAKLRTWRGPWEFFTPLQKAYILEDIKQTKSHIPKFEERLPELLYNNAQEIRDYLQLLPYCPHIFFQPGTCPPGMYRMRRRAPKISGNQLRRTVAAYHNSGTLHSLPKPIHAMLERRFSYPRYIYEQFRIKSQNIQKNKKKNNDTDNNYNDSYYWPRVPLKEDPRHLYKEFNKQIKKNKKNKNTQLSNENDTNEIQN